MRRLLNAAHAWLVEHYGFDRIETFFAEQESPTTPTPVAKGDVLPPELARWGETRDAERGQNAMMNMLSGG